MQVQGETTVLRQTEKPLEQRLKIRRRSLPSLTSGGHAEDAAGLRDLISQQDTFVAGKTLQRTETDRLQVDAAGPLISQPAEHCPLQLGTRPVAVEVRADRSGAVGVSATQAKFEALFDIGFRVVFVAVGDDGVPCARMGAVRVGLPGPGLRLVQMHMPIDEAGPNLTAVEIEAFRRGSRRADRGDASIGNTQIETCQTLGVNRSQSIYHRGRDRGVTQPEISRE